MSESLPVFFFFDPLWLRWLAASKALALCLPWPATPSPPPACFARAGEQGLCDGTSYRAAEAVRFGNVNVIVFCAPPPPENLAVALRPGAPLMLALTP